MVTQALTMNEQLTTSKMLSGLLRDVGFGLVGIEFVHIADASSSFHTGPSSAGCGAQDDGPLYLFGPGGCFVTPYTPTLRPVGLLSRIAGMLRRKCHG